MAARPKRYDMKVLGTILLAAIDWLWFNLRPSGFSGNESHLREIQMRRRRLPVLSLKALDQLGLDDLYIVEALTTGLTLSERFNLFEYDVKVRKQILRWAIERDCTGLVEDLWTLESDGNLGDSAFSRGYDEIFWAINIHIAQKDMLNTILSLLATVDGPLSAPLRLREDLYMEWWSTSRQRNLIESSYEKYDNALIAASANSQGLDLVQLLVDEIAAADMPVEDYESAARVAAEHKNIETMEFLLALVVSNLDKLNKDKDKDVKYKRSIENWRKQLLFAGSWGHTSYLEGHLRMLPENIRDGQLLLILQEAWEAAQHSLLENGERKEKDVQGLDRWKAAELIEQRLKKCQEDLRQNEDSSIGVDERIETVSLFSSPKTTGRTHGSRTAQLL